jgi:hypothetical protein
MPDRFANGDRQTIKTSTAKIRARGTAAIFAASRKKSRI